jgi:mono/diheme cytochrome c family protein
MNSRLARGLLIIGVVLAPFILGLLLTYQILRIPFPTDMAEQPSIGYQAGPRRLPAKDSVPIQGLAIDPDGIPVNPVHNNETSLQRGKILYDINCQLCHGDQGHGDGPLAYRFVEPAPRNLTEQSVTSKADGSLYITIMQGFRTMPPLSENVTPREAWDIVNYLRTLPPLP